MPEVEGLVLLFGIAFLAGMVDVIAGGGGLLTIPALLFVGVPPLDALATNKVQSLFSPLYATYFFFKKGIYKLKILIIPAFFSLLGAILGVMSVKVMDASLLEKVIVLVLVFFALYCIFSPQFSKEDRKSKLSWTSLSFFTCFLGFYDGFLGAGVGTILTLLFVVIFGMGAMRAIAHAKFFNLLSNLSSFFIFAFSGLVIWKVGIIMALGSVLGSFIGSRLVYLHAEKIIKPVVVVISLGMCFKILFF